MNKNFDVIVLGLGAHGSSAIYHLSKTGYKVCGIDRFKPPHNFGSSHGQSRIIRQAYHESPMYVPVVKKAFELWYELEQLSGKKLLLKTGGLILGNEDAAIIKGAKLSAETHDIPYEYLYNKEIAERFPALKIAEDTVAVLEEDAGILFPEKCIGTNLQLAEVNDAELLYNEIVTNIISENDVIEIITNKDRYQTKKLIVSAGAWLNELLPELHLPLHVERQVLYWFRNTNTALQKNLQPENLPIYIWEYMPGKTFYGFPDLGDGIKIAFHHAGEKILPGTLRKQKVTKAEIESIQHIASSYLQIESVFNYSDVCMYTNTPDEHFIIDHHPANNNIIIASPCSGHGFKFSSAIGKMLADMATNKLLDFDLTPFKISRFFK